jgi:hypothetical protein
MCSETWVFSPIAPVNPNWSPEIALSNERNRDPVAFAVIFWRPFEYAQKIGQNYATLVKIG